ncbi:MAG: hypothetical protein JXA89_16130, partial [Anaerolineae bacterium]|nr:hypothetical protein [Anaerolineae bacterium]
WWQARTETRVDIADVAENAIQVHINGPDGVTVLARGVEVNAPTVPWADHYHLVKASNLIVTAATRPFIGVSPAASEALRSFVEQQGYIVEMSEQRARYACYLEQAEFTERDQRSLLARIEETDAPLVRLGRWPNGARSALSITGDIDALTLWDYGLRLFEK